MKSIVLEPDVSNLIESTRAIGYSFSTALADIIDNSVSSDATEINVEFDNGSDDSRKAYVAVIDNGIGLDENEIINAMKYGSKWALEDREISDLGRFGLGLKLASLSQCKKLTVISLKNDIYNAVSWDLNHIYKVNKWELLFEDYNNYIDYSFYKILNKYKQGTIVLWEIFDRFEDRTGNFSDLFDKEIELASDHIGLVFHRYIDSSKNRIIFYFNGRKIDAVDPYYINNTATQKLDEKHLKIKDVRIKVIPYIIPFKSRRKQKEKQLDEKYSHLRLGEGLYIYRNKRLIVYGKWFRLLSNNNFSSLVRVMIDIPNSIDDIWSLDIKKSSLDIPHIIRDPLKKFIIEAYNKSERVINYPKEKRNRDSEKGIIHTFDRYIEDGKIFYKVNSDLPILKAIRNELSDSGQRYLSKFISIINEEIPYKSIYADLSDKTNDWYTFEYNKDNDIYDEIYFILESAENKEQKISLLESFCKLERYQNYIKVLNKIEKELKNNE